MTATAPATTVSVQYEFAITGTYAGASDEPYAFFDNAVLGTNQTISFGALGGKTYGDADVAVSATADSGLAVTFSSTTLSVCTVSGTTVHIVAAGTCTIRASQPGDTTYNAAVDVDQSFTISKGNQTITFTQADVTLGDPDFALGATASSGYTGRDANRYANGYTDSGAADAN